MDSYKIIYVKSVVVKLSSYSITFLPNSISEFTPHGREILNVFQIRSHVVYYFSFFSLFSPLE